MSPFYTSLTVRQCLVGTNATCKKHHSFSLRRMQHIFLLVSSNSFMWLPFSLTARIQFCSYLKILSWSGCDPDTRTSLVKRGSTWEALMCSLNQREENIMHSCWGEKANWARVKQLLWLNWLQHLSLSQLLWQKSLPLLSLWYLIYSILAAFDDIVCFVILHF